MGTNNSRFLSCIDHNIVNAIIQRIILNVLVPKTSLLKKNCLYLLHQWTKDGPINPTASLFCRYWDKVKNHTIPENYTDPRCKDKMRRSKSSHTQKLFICKSTTIDPYKEMYGNKENSNRMANTFFDSCYHVQHNSEREVAYKICQKINSWIENEYNFEEEAEAMHKQLIERQLTGNKDQDLTFTLNLLKELPILIVKAQRAKDRIRSEELSKRSIISQNKAMSSRLRINDTMQISKKELDDMELPEEVLDSCAKYSKDEFNRVENEWFSNIPTENIWEHTPQSGIIV